ncbi:MAG TPA: glycosyltransferase family 87 protein [Bacteroidia bacterium]|nr:glycosyltransferase family 87 protein [Bacteroidia bacterium]
MKNPIYFFLFAYALLAAFVIAHFDGTGDTGDSVLHYLFARYAPDHPGLFFHHWAKPVFVLLASPFAHFGFTGMKIFNAGVSLLTIFFTYKIASQLNFRNPIVVAVILIFTPLYFALTFSGLTEPLFALFVAVSIFLLLREKYIAATLLISFLPFVRSEGLILIGVFAIYLLMKRKWKFLPLLIAGHVVYSFAGYFVHHDLLWVFRKIPYAHLDSVYGKGPLFHFADKLLYLLGIPIYILFGLGLISIIWETIKKKSNYNEQVLLFFGFLAFFIAHSLFWYLGIFGSMGLVRVFIGIIPIIALIALKGYNFFTETLFGKMKMPQLIFKGLFILYILIFPFTPNNAALNVDRDLKLAQEQIAVRKVADYIITRYDNHHQLCYEHPYFGIAFQTDPFDLKKVCELNTTNIRTVQSGCIVIWDSHIALIDMGVTKKSIDSDSTFTNIYNLKSNDNGKENSFSVYWKK